jgi:hypothetical protein
VNIHHYTPTDAEFEVAYTQPISRTPVVPDPREKSLLKYSPTFKDNDNSLDNTIFHLEEEIKEKEVLVKDL